MFKENIEIIKYSYEQFQGTGMYFALFLVAMLYIFLKEKDRNRKILLLYFPILVFCVITNPIFNKFVGSIFTVNTYWRVFWLLPIGIVIGYAAVLVVNENKEKSQKIIVTVSLFIIIALSGKLIYNDYNYQECGNAYKLPDESVLVAQLIGVDEQENKKAILPETLVAHVRQIDASIELLVGRVPDQGFWDNPIMSELNNGNVNFIANIAKEKKCQYVVFKKATVLCEPMEDYGFEKINETQNYAIYKLRK